MQIELNELKDFIEQIKADRAAAKDKEKREAWTKYVSLTLVCLAVLTGIATLKGGGFTTLTLKQMNEATFNQAQASDQWAFFQAKSIKKNLYEIDRDHLTRNATADPEALNKVKQKIDKYEKEMADISKKAGDFEAAREAARDKANLAANHSKGMGLAITFFQVAIAMGGICLVVKRKSLWFLSLALGLYSAFQMLKVLTTPL